MENKQGRKIIVSIFLISLYLVNTIYATNWFVRPSGKVYGLGDGTSYENAWNQMTYQEWQYIEPGDTLYVCGLFVTNMILIKKSGLPGNPITIRGDYYEEPGTVLAASTKFDSLWVQIDSANNIWSQKWELNELFPMYLCFEKSDTLGVDGLIRLTKMNDTVFSSWVPGSYYYDEYDSTIFYKPSEGDANDYIFYTNGYAPLAAQGQHNINIINIKLIGGYHAGISLENSPTNITINGVSIKWSSWSGITFYPGLENDSARAIPSENITIRNCAIEGTKDGIYPYGLIKNIKIIGNTIKNIDQNTLYGQRRDTHSIGLQGAADSLLIEYNHIHHGGGEGIVLYYDDRWTGMKNVTIRYNKIHDIYANVENMSTHRGIDFGHGFLSTEQLSEVYNDSIYYNIIYNVGQHIIHQSEDEIMWKGQGIRLKSVENPNTLEPTWFIYNNIIDNCNIGFSQYFGWSATEDTMNIVPAFDLRNNVIMNSVQKHIAINLRGVRYDRFIINNNLYFPDGDLMFRAPEFGEGDFLEWQNWNDQFGREQNSISESPLFINNSIADYHITESSPMIDIGFNHGISPDYEGNVVPQGNGTDIGAYESPFTVSIQQIESLPEEYILYNNYPNPFNPSTKISYSIPHRSFVTLKVYDVLGNEIAALVEGDKQKGYYYVEFDASHLSSGVYFYKLHSGDFTDTKKLIVLR